MINYCQFIATFWLLLSLTGGLQVRGESLEEYLIWPRENITRKDADSIEMLLRDLTPDATKIYAPDGPNPSFWLAYLSNGSYEKVAKHPDVLDIDINEAVDLPVDPVPINPYLLPRNTTTLTTPRVVRDNFWHKLKSYRSINALTELRVISQRPNTPLSANKDFVYAIDDSEEVFIYDIGLGINRAHWDFSSPHRRIEWLYTPQTRRVHRDTPNEHTGYDPSGHSTCTASKAAGRAGGSARHATLVVVKFIPTIAGYAELFETVMHDIVAKGRMHHSVVILTRSRGQGRNPCKRLLWNKVASDMMLLIRRGVPVVVSAGNRGPGFTNHHLPCGIADHKDNLMGPIVVGAVDNDGNKAPWSQELQYGRMLWAPGVDVLCAQEFPDIGTFVTRSGTSYAAPLAAGVIAERLTEMNHLGLFHPARRNQFIYDNMQWKRPSGLPVLWNGMDGPDILPDVSAGFNETATAKRRMGRKVRYREDEILEEH